MRRINYQDHILWSCCTIHIPFITDIIRIFSYPKSASKLAPLSLLSLSHSSFHTPRWIIGRNRRVTGVQITIFHDFHRGRWFAAYVAPRDCVSMFKREKRCTLRVGRGLSGLALPRVSRLVFAAPRGTFVGKQTAVTGSTSRTRACACTRLLSLAHGRSTAC